MTERKVWLVTGCSTGFGKELVKLLAKKELPVVATVRKEAHRDELKAINPDFVHPVLLDVQQQETINAAKSYIDKNLGRIDVLVNNAGYGSIGPVEEVSEEEMQRQFDVNVFGAVRMIKMVLPFMRSQKSGHILNITSIAGLNGFPGVGIYNGSKFALEGIGEALAAELGPLGIRVTNIEPGPFRTDWAGRSLTTTSKSIEDYASAGHKNLDAIVEVSGKQIGDPVRAAKAMIDITEVETPPVHLPLGRPAYKRVGIRLEEFKQEIEAFRHVGEPTDYTEEELKKLDQK
jgi:NAD(P)-dependent dehydrogenase (short-subunit alcohol dehydrogenase family)